MFDPKRAFELNRYADWLQADYMGRVNDAVEVCEVISREKGDKLTLEEGKLIFELLNS